MSILSRHNMFRVIMALLGCTAIAAIAGTIDGMTEAAQAVGGLTDKELLALVAATSVAGLVYVAVMDRRVIMQMQIDIASSKLDISSIKTDVSSVKTILTERNHGN